MLSNGKGMANYVVNYAIVIVNNMGQRNFFFFVQGNIFFVEYSDSDSFLIFSEKDNELGELLKF